MEESNLNVVHSDASRYLDDFTVFCYPSMSLKFLTSAIYNVVVYVYYALNIHNMHQIRLAFSWLHQGLKDKTSYHSHAIFTSKRCSGNKPIPHWSCTKNEIKLLMYRFLHLFLSTTECALHPTRKQTFWFWFHFYPLVISYDFWWETAFLNGTARKNIWKVRL